MNETRVRRVDVAGLRHFDSQLSTMVFENLSKFAGLFGSRHCPRNPAKALVSDSERRKFL